ncbi:TPA: hypothetical protein ACVU5S_003284 [Vibrio parahaemolyticus]|uniref:hypothetical protein n=1 Tax=Vibrio TaxID=662 RepID=UPI0004DFAB98|nr:hypothetical protein [Vibrio parahaemolyticus]ATI47245.1 hypothetical protein CO725_17125 [Vibrio parahaemolyticus]EJB8585007.1 hypothetical protein [Vibrio parahaemolyticus]ELA9389110.1 hypothetical protein [Vibrio parahaemolyticus]MBE5181202.1 hypothetical protein [Vibrio parahaemolyticus]MDF4987661.1 hypothetical protein [Vibrio parahaemolyticus]
MRKYYFISLIVASTSLEAANSYLPYELVSGGDVILSVNSQGRLSKSNIDNFCSVFRENQPNIMKEYQNSFGQVSSRNLQVECKVALKGTINSLKSIGYTRCIENPFNNDQVAELCKGFKKEISKYKPQLNFFSGEYARIKLEQHQQELESIEQSNAALLASIEKQQSERLSFCDQNYQKVKDNDLKGVMLTKTLLDVDSELVQLKEVSKFKYLSPSMDTFCLKQERYKNVLNQVNNSKTLLKSRINQFEKKQREIVIVQQVETERKPEKTVYNNSMSLLESGVNLPEGVEEHPEVIPQMVRLIQLTGYKCDSISAIREMMLSRGFTVVCNNFFYEYDIEDKGGNWVVTLQ